MKFSCLMPTKNRPEWIGGAVESILSQSGQADRSVEIELIVNDGGKSIEALLPHNDLRVRYIRQNTGIADALNNAMRIAVGDIFVQTNDDDRLLPAALLHVYDIIAASRISGHPVEWVYGRVLRGDQPYSRQCELIELLTAGNIIAQPAVFWTRRAYETVGDFDESVDLACDYDYWIRLWKHFEPAYTDEILAIYTEHPGMATHTRSGEQCDAGRRVMEKHRER